MSDFGGKWPRKWKFSKMSFRIPRRDTELRFLTIFGKNRPLRSSRMVAWFTKQKNSGSAGLVPAPILAKMGRSRPKFPERCHPLTCSRVPNLVRIGCVLPDLFRKDWFWFFDFSAQKFNTLIGFQPTIIKDSARVTFLLRVTTDGHKASRGFSATADLLVFTSVPCNLHDRLESRRISFQSFDTNCPSSSAITVGDAKYCGKVQPSE